MSVDINPFEKYLPKPNVSYPDVGVQNQKYLKKVYVQTWGCQMNVSDTERMLSLLGQRNYRPTDSADEADLILLNTCHIREKARHKVVSRLGELKQLKVDKPDTVFAVSGCVAQAEAKKLADDVPYLDLVFGPDQIEDLPAMLERIALKNEKISEYDPDFILKEAPTLETGFNDQNYSIPVDVVPPYTGGAFEPSRYVNIIKGCNNFCTFCVVPFTRGREKSRTTEEVVQEVSYLVERNVKEVVLLGQNVNSYGLDLNPDDKDGKKAIASGELPFADLLYSVAKIPGLERIRFTTSNPHDFTKKLAQAFADLPQITNQFHLPVQSGSNRILDRMNRQYTREEYLERVGWIRAVRPDIAFSTDIIVGFPGESDADFEETMSLVEAMKYSFIYAFKYSPRKGTAATRFRDQVPEEIKDKRLQRLLALQQKETLRQNLAEIGKTREALILYKNRKDSASWYGRSYEGRLIKVYSDKDILGQIVPVQITEANATALVGNAVLLS